ncbi:MAG TPA: thioredoxin domain-containing protein, partial [Mucilaginibacter sp.]
RKNDWTSLLFNLADFYKNKPNEAEEYAERLTTGIQQYESVPFVKEQQEYTRADLETIITSWKKYFDPEEGGLGSAPKFPMPNNWQCLMRYAHLAGDDEVANAVKLTLHKMAFGGIYDHVGGGFARYSVDDHWHVPHFEKMLYDNAQLISLYSEGYTWQPDELYRTITDEIIEFCSRELMAPNFGFYSALDADSEGKEGKFYIFTKSDIEEILGDDAELFCIYYNITERGNWEEEHSNVLFRRDTDEQLAEKLGLPITGLQEKVAAAKQKVFTARSYRIRPGLDNKILASWNGLMLKGLCDAYRAFNKREYLELALKNADFILTHLVNKEGRLNRIFKHIPTGNDKAEAFLDDYANVADALIALYEITFDEQWLMQAKCMIDLAIQLFYEDEKGIFYFTASDDEQLIARKSEIMDGVIPASNSVMARNLKKLGLLFDKEEYLQITGQLLRNIVPYMARYGSSYSNWIMLLTEEVFGTYEIAIAGDDFEGKRSEIESSYIPNKIMLGGKKGTLPLLEDKFGAGTQIFICKDKTCGLPVTDVKEALKQITIAG